MTTPTPPEVFTINSVTVVRPGADFSNLYESLLDNLELSTGMAQSLPAPLLVVDMQHVKFIGSAFLGRMVSLQKAFAATESGRFALCGMSSFCRAALGVSRLDSVLEVFPTAEDAAAAFAAGS